MDHPFLRKLFDLVRERRFRRVSQLIYQSILNMVYRILPFRDGMTVMEEEWDYLIVLDACRYDMFKELNKLTGVLHRKISKASSTPEWISKNFSEYYDVVYISANPHISSVEVRGFKGTNHFFKVVNVWDFGWDEELNTVPPWEVTSSALRAKEKYPGKRMIIHYMQPHGPWIGETKLSSSMLKINLPTAIEWVDKGDLWDKVEKMGIDLAFLRKAYRDNLKLVMNEVKNLIQELDGKIVVTADHGECLGDRFLFGHPTGVYVNELIEVPYLVIRKPKTDKNLDNAKKRRVMEIVRQLKARGKI